MKLEGAIVFLISLVHLGGVNGRPDINIEISVKQEAGIFQGDNHKYLSSENSDVIFAGPYDKEWQGCHYISTGEGMSLNECQKRCIKQRRSRCTAIRYNGDMCNTYNCGWPVRSPQGAHYYPWKGYAIADVCRTDSKCGLRGGFCIPHNEECNGNTITEEGYCNKNYYKIESCKCCLTPTVYMRDIENTIAYAFRNRAPYAFWGPPEYDVSITPSKLSALSEFAQVLINHLPLKYTLKNFLECLIFEFGKISQTIKGGELEEYYRDCTDADSELPEVTPWVSCRNTNDLRIRQLRTYPCGVWITFHTITVNLTDQNADDILPTLAEVVNHFPWCTDCQKHFKHMYSNLRGMDMKTAKDVTLWLWRAHNKVSVRVADGFDVKDRTLIESNCEDYTPTLNRLQDLTSACKFECKVKKTIMEDCKYITIPTDPNAITCEICKGDQIRQETSDYTMYVLNTATETPGRRKSLFPDFKLCLDCWIIVDDPFDFTTKTNKTAVLDYLKEIYNADAIVLDT